MIYDHHFPKNKNKNAIDLIFLFFLVKYVGWGGSSGLGVRKGGVWVRRSGWMGDGRAVAEKGWLSGECGQVAGGNERAGVGKGGLSWARNERAGDGKYGLGGKSVLSFSPSPHWRAGLFFLFIQIVI